MSGEPPRSLFYDRLGMSIFSCLSMIGGGAVIIWPAQAFFGWAMLIVGSTGLVGTLGHLAWTKWSFAPSANPAFVGLVAFVALAVMVFWVAYTLGGRFPPPFPQQVAATTGEPSPSPAPNKQDRIMLAVDAAFLANIYRSRTQVEADRIFAPYIHQWLKVRGTVRNVSELSLGTNDDYLVVVKMAGNEKPTAMLRFRSQWKDRLLALPLGHDIAALCSVRVAGEDWVGLESCELD